MYPSGRWQGYWEEVGFGRQYMEPLEFRFTGKTIEGQGEDCLGPFVFHGSISDRGEVLLLKQYLGKHSVNYVGRVEGEGTIVGRWSIEPAWSGPFALWPSVEKIGELPINEFPPPPNPKI